MSKSLVSSGVVGQVYKGSLLGLDPSVLLSARDYGVPARGLLSAVVVEHKYPGQRLGCTCGAGDKRLSLHSFSCGGDTSSCV